MKPAELKPAARAAGERVHVGIHWLLPPVLLFVGYNLGLTVEALAADTTVKPVCVRGAPGLPDIPLGALGIAAFVGGRFLSLLGSNADQETRERASRGSLVLGQVALACGFLMLVLIWLYEAMGIAHVPFEKTTLEPITYYVRCAILLDKSAGFPWTTVATVVVVSGLAGHWLWAYHPRKEDRLKRLHVDAETLKRAAV
jgi:hypothetical protein